ncbi:MAG: ABC transporter ATP-binding protein [Abditibacteriales bacterium]|nr:ABC transporter ATP-binding protein [Abditibacteriales bacterium]MDW8365427.1 ABC transporter ATP-binding protein [Abditibacteriales bacterium]
MLSLSITKQLNDFTLDVSFAVNREILVLFGPSGAGKTTTLQCIAGLQTPDSGVIRFDGEVIFEAKDGRLRCNVPVHRRRVGYVFQEYALFPHMTVRQNIAYGARRLPNVKQQVEEMLRRMRLEGLGDRYPQELSGGQQQRVAIARALMIQPRVLLLDEPFSALDGAVREQLCEDIRRTQREMGLSIVYVTHSLEDAFSIGHRLAVINEGHLEQIGDMSEVFHHPWTPEVARILGTTNVFEGRVERTTAEATFIAWRGVTLEVLPQPLHPTARVMFYICPEDVKIIYPDRPLSEAVRHNILHGVVVRNIPHGAMNTLFFKSPDLVGEREYDLEVRYPNRAYQTLSLTVGSPIQVALRKDAIHLLPTTSDERVS